MATTLGTPEVWRDGRGSVLLRGEHSAEQLAAAQAVGYHNYFRVGLYDALDLVRARCPEGWRAATDRGIADDDRPLAVRVGQVLVRHGDPSYPLYIVPSRRVA
jgi:hypothetical protein